MKLYPLGIVGESSYQPAIRRTNPGERAMICHEPDNPFDSMALRVENATGEVIGYIATSSWLRRAIHEEGRGVAATIKSISSSGENGCLGVVLDVTLTDDDLPRRSFSGTEISRPHSDAPQPRPRIEAPSGTSADEYLAPLIRASVFPVTCDCGAVYRTGLAGMSVDTVLDCPSCKAPNTLDAETFERLQGEFLAAAHQLLRQAKHSSPTDETILAKLAASPRPRTEMTSPRREPKPGLWKRWFSVV